MNKNILIVGHSGDMYGASRSLSKLVRILDRHYTVYVLLPEKGELYNALIISIPTERILIYEDLYIFTRKSFKLQYLPSTLLRFLKNLYRICHIISKYNIELIHTNSGVVPAPALAAKIKGKKHLWHIREWFGDFRKFWPIYSAYIKAFSDRIICVSQTMASQFGDSKKVKAIYNGFEIPNIKTKPILSADLTQKFSGADLILGCTSRIRLIRKGQEYLIEAIGILSGKTEKKIHAIIIGDYVPGYEDQKTVIDSLINKYKLEDQIHFLGHLNDPLPYYQFFDVFVLPSGEPEPFGGVIMEAMSIGLPVIGSNAGGTTEQIADGWNGYLFENQNAADLANKIKLFLDEPSKLRLFGTRSKERIEKHFSLELHQENILELYRGVFSN
jgi:glycosyltransferase involved in cell wall biosynthesis